MLDLALSSPWSEGTGSRPSKAGSVHVKLRMLSTAAESPPLFSPPMSLHTHTHQCSFTVFQLISLG